VSAFSAAIAQALASVAAAAGETVTYHRGDESTGELTAVPGSQQRRAEDVYDVPVDASSRDWIFEAAGLVIDGVEITPRRGDQVRQTVAGVETVYEVASDGDQVYRYCDRGRTRIRVHTKQKGS
jgi:hypothetical protein